MFLTNDTSCNNFTDASLENRLSIGAVTISGNQTAMWAGDDEGATTMVNTRATRNDVCMLAAIPNATDSSTSGTVIFDFVAFSGDGFTINKTANSYNGTASGMTFTTLILGDIIPEQFLPGENATQKSFGGRHPLNYTFGSSPIFGY
jgi:hypothetical protein